MALDTEVLSKHCQRRAKELFAAFDRRKDLLLEVARELMPGAIAGLTRDVQEIADGYIYDEDHRILTTAPIDALRRGAAGFHGNLTSPATRWFRLKLPEHATDGETTHEDRIVIDRLTEATEWVFARSNAYAAIHKLYEHLLAFGFGCLMVSESKTNICRVETLRVGTYALGIGADGMVDTVVRKFSLTAPQIIEQFGEKNCPKVIVDSKCDHTRRFEVANLIEPHPTDELTLKDDKVARACDFASGGNTQQTIYRSLYYLPAFSGAAPFNGFLKAVGFSIRPFVAPRMECETGDVYGRGRGLDALDLARGCQSFKFDELTIVGNIAQPAIIADAELKDEGLKLYRGAVTYCPFGDRRGAMAAPILPHNPPLNLVLEERAQCENEIAKLFYNDAFSVIDAVKNGKSGQMTATEVETIVRDAMQRLAPVATLFDKELLDPLVGIMTAYAQRLMDTNLSDDLDIKVEYVSAIHNAQKQTQLAAIQQTIQSAGTMAQIAPDVLLRLDADKTFQKLASLLSFPESCLKSDEDVIAALQARQQQEAASKQQEVMSASAKAMREMGGIQIDEAHAGSVVVDAIKKGGLMS